MTKLSLEEMATMIAIKNARAAAGGRPCPVAARVLARIETAIAWRAEVARWIAEGADRGTR